jgi:predicted nucleic acid-binding Zn ribbon protein
VRARRRGPRPLASALEHIRDELAPETVLARAQRRWSEVVGASIAAEARPTAERGGVLTVSCSSSLWAHELDLMSPTILEGLNAALRGGRIDRLRCVAAPFSERSA